MRKLVIIVIALSLVVLSRTPVFALGSGNGIVGSPHDFSGETWNSTGEICRVCHVPHDHNRDRGILAGGLLWNHELSTATYTMYDSYWSSTLDNQVSSQPDGTAKLCLGCHDGTVAIDTFDKYAGGTKYVSDWDPDYQIPTQTNGTALDLRATHPISIVYDNTVDPGLKDPTTTAMGLSGFISDVLDNGKVQCSTCHDVHDQEAVANTHLLRVAQTTQQGGSASGLCLTCHIK